MAELPVIAKVTEQQIWNMSFHAVILAVALAVTWEDTDITSDALMLAREVDQNSEWTLRVVLIKISCNRSRNRCK